MQQLINIIQQQICPVIAPRIAAVLAKLPQEICSQISEIRLRTGLPLLVVTGNRDYMVALSGELVHEYNLAVAVQQTDVWKTVQILSKNSLYALENELCSGFITIAGGHRVGLAGQALVEEGQVKMLKYISSLTIRIARQMIGCADKIMPWLIDKHGNVYNTLFVSPPRCGKTTLIRDVARQLSNGIPGLGICGKQVGIVDERSEIAASQQGTPTMNIGCRTDILDSCPKATGMLMLIRSMAPELIITDELGRAEDAIAVEEALHAGVGVIATAHGRSVSDIKLRPYISRLALNEYFDRYIVLGNQPDIGSIVQIAAANGEILYGQ